MDKIQAMNDWLDKQEVHHRAKSDNKKNITEEVFADAMKLIKARIKNTGWDAAFKYVKKGYEENKDSNIVGPHAIAQVYLKIKTKMWSLDRKFK